MGAPFSRTIGTTPARVVDYSKNRTVVMIYNNSSQIVYLGTGSGVSTSDGFPLSPYQGAVFAMEFGDDPSIAYYAVTGSGTADIRVWEGYGKTTGALIEELTKIMKR